METMDWPTYSKKVMEDEYKARMEYIKVQNPQLAQVGDAIRAAKPDAYTLEKQVEGSKPRFMSAVPEVQQQRELLRLAKEELDQLDQARAICARKFEAIKANINEIKKQNEADVNVKSMLHVAEHHLHMPVSAADLRPMYVYNGAESDYAIALCGCKILFPQTRAEKVNEDPTCDREWVYQDVLRFKYCWLHKYVYRITHTQAWEAFCVNMYQQRAIIPSPMYFSTGTDEPGLHYDDWDGGVVIRYCSCQPCLEVRSRRQSKGFQLQHKG